MMPTWLHIHATTWRIWPPMTRPEARRSAVLIITYRALMKLIDAMYAGAIGVEEYARKTSVLLRQLDD